MSDASGVESVVVEVCVGDFGMSKFEEVVDGLVHAVLFVEVDCVSTWTCEAVDGDIGDALFFEFVEVCFVADLEGDGAIDAP